ERYIAFVKTNHYFEHKRNSQSKYWMYESINEYLKNNFYQNKEIQQLLVKNEARVLSNEISSFIAAKDLLDTYFKK
ncbi:MAG: methylmalonyl Co-A mutase-associated GTPase MeaB, partial [Paludibacter sp.]|nr:methylmalonyl Co-A mutase-associated GTPase MeaB [Paludibacter sp.]